MADILKQKKSDNSGSGTGAGTTIENNTIIQKNQEANYILKNKGKVNKISIVDDDDIPTTRDNKRPISGGDALENPKKSFKAKEIITEKKQANNLFQPTNIETTNTQDRVIQPEENSAPNEPYQKKYIVIESVELSSIINDRLVGSQENFCFKDKSIREQYLSNIEALKDKVLELTDKKELLEKQKDEEKNKTQEEILEIRKNLAELDKKIQELNAEIRENYDKVSSLPPSENMSSYNGYKIIRKDPKGNKTNLASSASSIEITTKGLNNNNAVRVQMSDDFYLEIHLDKDGNFLADGNILDYVTPLNNSGSIQPTMFRGELSNNNKKYEYKNYDDVFKRLNNIKSIKVNGVDVKEKILQSIMARENSKNKEEELEDKVVKAEDSSFNKLSDSSSFNDSFQQKEEKRDKKKNQRRRTIDL